MLKREVSIIIPLYKGKKYLPCLKRTVINNMESLGADNIEVIFVNDYPEEKIMDEDVAILNVAVKLIHNDRNQGIHASRVRGLEMAEAEYVVFLDQDDLLEPKYLKSQLLKIGEADAVICNGFWGDSQIYPNVIWNESLDIENYFFNREIEIVSPGQVLLKRDSIPELWKRNVLKHNGADDFFLWSLLLDNGAKIVINPEALYTHVNHDGNTSYNISEMNASLEEMMKKIEGGELVSRNVYEKMRVSEENRKTRNLKWKQAVLDCWDELAEQLAEMLCNKKNYAVYGYGELGQRLVQDMVKRELTPRYVIDKHAFEYNSEACPILSLDEVVEKVDCVIVTLMGQLLVTKGAIAEKKITKEIVFLKEYIS